MSTAVSTLLALLVLAGTAAVLQRYSPLFALPLSLGGTLWLLFRLGQTLQDLLQGIVQLGQRTDGQAFACLLRSVGILLLTDYTCTLCKEAGAETLAWCAGLAGRCFVLAAVWPLLRMVCQTILGVAG